MDTEALAAAFPLASPDLPAPLPGDPPPTGGVLYGLNPASAGIVLVGPVGAGQPQLRRPGPLRRRQVLLRQARGAAQPVPRRRRSPSSTPRTSTLRLADARRRHRRPARRRRRAGQPARPAGRRPPPRRADPPRPVPAHPHRGAARRSTPPPAERAALDRAILAAYRRPGSPPTRPPGPPARAAAARPRRHPGRRRRPGRARSWPPGSPRGSAGSFDDLFDGPTTTRPDGHLVVWSLRHLPDELRTVGTLLALDAIWRAVDTPDRAAAGRRRGGWSWSTRRGCCCATAKAPGSCSGWPRPPANATPA